jgi:uncharacterized membrane protein YjjB (DUF3815 family)
VFFQLVFGVALGSTLAAMLGSPPYAIDPLPMPTWTDPLAVGVCAVAFVVLYQARPRDAAAILLAAWVAILGARWGARALGPELGAWVGAVALGVVANAFSRWRNRPAAVLMVPGILLLVPGSLGLRSLTWMLQNETLLGAGATFRTMLVAIALATGILTANVFVSPRRGL